MLSEGMTVRSAAERWVGGFNAFPHSMIQKLMEVDIDSWHEVTKPSRGCRVYVYDPPESEHSGEIANQIETADVWLINLDDGNTVEIGRDDFEFEFDCTLPMWGTLWQFDDPCDTYWIENADGISQLSAAGFRVYEHEEWGYFFGIDGAGYDFYESHWIPLYKARGLQWHDPKTVQGAKR